MGKDSALCKISVLLLGTVALAQIAAIAAPGWMIIIQGNDETHFSVFYKMKCETLVENRCQIRSMKDLFEEDRDAKVEAKLGHIAIDRLGELLV